MKEEKQAEKNLENNTESNAATEEGKSERRKIQGQLILGFALILGLYATGAWGKELAEKEELGIIRREMVQEAQQVQQVQENQVTAGSREISTVGMLKESQSWGLGFGGEGERPTGNATAEELAKYRAYYIGPAQEKVLYLTFDCGYENGNTPAILDALKKQEVQATFFVVGHYLETAPELVKRMVQEGHTVGNHTYHHPDISALGEEKFREETDSVNALFEEVTGEKMSPYFRPPQGKFNEENLMLAQKLGYHTFFWSLAYVDWNTDQQPRREEALSKLYERTHPGAIVLLHNTSSTNAEILEELLCGWKERGYSFGTLEQLCGVR